MFTPIKDNWQLVNRENGLFNFGGCSSGNSHQNEKNKEPGVSNS